MAAVDSLDALLQFLQNLKPPGASQAKIQEITSLCIENIQVEASLVQKIFTYFKKAPTTHKLGVLYVVDSVTRQWMSRATQAGQKLAGATAPQGTYAAGVHKMTEIVPLMMNELLSNYPEKTQKEKVKKLIDIWDHGNTFPKALVTAFRSKLEASSNGSNQNAIESALNLPVLMGTTAPPLATPAPASADASSILAALSALGTNGNPSTGATLQPTLPQQPSASNIGNPPMPFPPMPLLNQPVAALPSQNGTSSGMNMGLYQSGTTNSTGATPLQQHVNVANPVVPPQLAQTNPANNPMLVQVLQAVISGQIPPDQAAQVLSLIGYTLPTSLPNQPTQAPTVPTAPPVVDPRQPEVYSSPPLDSNRHAMHGGSREYQRYRSRSPDRGARRATPPNRRDSPTYGTYDPSQAADIENRGRQNESDRRGRGRGRNRNNDFRQRTPPPQRRDEHVGTDRIYPRNIEFDNTLPEGHIRVLSRTLFVGGVTASEDELRDIFTRFGSVQTCVVNRDKRHAFVKMYNRVHAVAAKKGMENNQDPDIANRVRSTRWGVGFGPRECSDYTNGVSVIPIDALTDADRKWVVTAENGGTGGAPIEGGLVMEEPDIEIGAGVSSKAISRRLGPDHGNARGGRNANLGSGRGGHNGNSQNNNHGRGRNKDRHDRQEARRPPSPRQEPNTIGVPPPVPGFGFQLPGLPMNFG